MNREWGKQSKALERPNNLIAIQINVPVVYEFCKYGLAAIFLSESTQ